MAPKTPPPKDPGKYGHGGKGEKYGSGKGYNGKACRHGCPIGACALCAKGK